MRSRYRVDVDLGLRAQGERTEGKMQGERRIHGTMSRRQAVEGIGAALLAGKTRMGQDLDANSRALPPTRRNIFRDPTEVRFP